MPGNVQIVAFVFGAALILLGLVGGGFKCFGIEIPGTVGRPCRILAFVFAVVFIFLGLRNPLSTTIPIVPISLTDKGNLLQNGGFEEDLKYWGTGYYETDVYKGSLGIFWASRVGMQPEIMKVADVRGEIDSQIRHYGLKSFKIINNSPPEAQIYGSMSQRVTGLLKNTDYIAEFWVKAERAGIHTLEITTDLAWQKRKTIEAGTYDWEKFSQIFNTGDNTFIDFRIISGEPGTVWIDDITFKKYSETQ